MWWMMIVGAVNGGLQGQAAREEGKANNRLSKLRAETNNKLRTARNAATASKNNLQRWVQSVNNNRRLDDGGTAVEANLVNYYRRADSQVGQNFAQSISSAEQAGVAAAMAANAGIDGQVVDMVNASTALRDSIVREQMQTSAEQAQWDTRQRAGMIMSQTVGGLDNSIIFDSLDYNVDVAKETPIMSHWANVIQGMGSSFGATGQGTDVMRERSSSGSFQTEAGEGLALRQRNTRTIGGENFDLADYSYDKKMRFGFKDPEQDDSPFSLSRDARLGETSKKDSNLWSLWSR